MKSVTLIFPGQGAQYVGMGNNLANYVPCQEVFKQANEALGFSITSLMSEGPDEKLALTEYTQPAIVTHSVALFAQLKLELTKLDVKIDRVLGHSVGEYSALVAAGALSFSDAVKAVNNRGKYMQEACPAGKGAMYAILRVPGETVAKACEEVSTAEEKVMCANYNDPTQVVISGHAPACKKAVEWLAENYEGRQMAKELNVSAPFHSSLMEPAEKNLTDFLNTIEFNNNTIPYMANIDAKEYSISGEEIKENLIKQVCGSVLWNQSMAKLTDGTYCIEVGPGKVLTGLNKRINKQLKTYTLDTETSFDGLKEFFA
jgi:[acyl-carrier-protein] S-malonyltransferase